MKEFMEQVSVLRLFRKFMDLFGKAFLFFINKEKNGRIINPGKVSHNQQGNSFKFLFHLVEAWI